MPAMLPFEPVSAFGMTTGNNIVVIAGDDYAVSILDGDGAAEASYQGFSQRPLVEERHRRKAGRVLPDTSWLDRLPVPTYLPAVKDVYSVAGRPGEFLVKSYWEDGGRVRWDRWSSSKGYAYSIALPDAVRHAAGHETDVIYGLVDRPIDGVPEVHVYRILAGQEPCPGAASVT